MNIIQLPGRDDDHVPFIVSALDVIDFDPTLGYSLVNFPKILLPIFDNALVMCQQSLHLRGSFATQFGSKGSVKRHIHTRIVSLPPLANTSKKSIGEIRSHEIGHLIQVSGTIVRTGTIRVLEVSKEYQCMKKRCGHRFRVYADPEQGNVLPTPRTCVKLSSDCRAEDMEPNNNIDSDLNNRGGGVASQKMCNSTILTEIAGSKVCVDYQEIRIQDKVVIRDNDIM